MLPLDVVLVFVGVATAIAAVPGPDNIFVLTQSAVHGRVAGLIVTLGIALGLFVHTTAVALGVAVIFQTSQYAFTALKYAGAAYLLYLARQAFRASKGKFDGDKSKSETASKQFLRGLPCVLPIRRSRSFSWHSYPNLSPRKTGQSSLSFINLEL